MASAQGKNDVVKHLLSHSNIDVDIGAYKNRTALFMASVNGKKDTVEILLTYEGIDITKADDNGETSITKARNEEIKELLKAKLKMKTSGKVLLSPLPATGKSEKMRR